MKVLFAKISNEELEHHYNRALKEIKDAPMSQRSYSYFEMLDKDANKNNLEYNFCIVLLFDVHKRYDENDKLIQDVQLMKVSLADNDNVIKIDDSNIDEKHFENVLFNEFMEEINN